MSEEVKSNWNVNVEGMSMQELATLAVTLTPTDIGYDDIVKEIIKRQRVAKARNRPMAHLGVIKGVPEKSAFRRAPDDEVADRTVPSTEGADLVRLLKEADPDSPQYNAYLNQIKAHAVKVELKKSNKGSMVARLNADIEEDITPYSHSLPISEQILGLGSLLSASELSLKRDIIRLGMKVKEMEEREQQLRKLFSLKGK